MNLDWPYAEKYDVLMCWIGILMERGEGVEQKSPEEGQLRGGRNGGEMFCHRTRSFREGPVLQTGLSQVSVDDMDQAWCIILRTFFLRNIFW